jgi:hypothetical protein
MFIKPRIAPNFRLANGEKREFLVLPTGLLIYFIMKRNFSQAVLHRVFQLFLFFLTFFKVCFFFIILLRKLTRRV